MILTLPSAVPGGFSTFTRSVMLMAGLAAAVSAASITVNTTSMDLVQDASCGLREAIQAVNTSNYAYGCPAGNGQSDVIYIPPGTYRTSEELIVTRSVYLTCAGASGACNIEPGTLHGFRLVTIKGNNPRVEMYNLTFRQPAANTQAISGMILESGSVSLDHIRITGFRGNGLMLLQGTTHLVGNSRIANNTGNGLTLGPNSFVGMSHDTCSNNAGAGLSVEGGASGTLNSSVVSGNGGSGLLLAAGVAAGFRFTVYNSIFSGNSGSGISGNGGLEMLRSVVSGNLNGGIHLSAGSAEIESCLVEKNRTSGNGGGISILSPHGISLKGSTVCDNKAAGNGGGLYLTGTGGIYSSTFSKDTAVNGGGIYHAPGSGGGTLNHLNIIHSTVAFNRATGTGGGVYTTGAGSATIRPNGSLIGQNSAPSAPDASGPIRSTNTLYSNVQGFTGTHNGDFYPLTPKLGPLMDNGGPKLGPLNDIGYSIYVAKTHALLTGSPGTDLVPHIDNPMFTSDQRGYPRPTLASEDLWDVGAYEAGPLENEHLFVVGRSSYFPHYVIHESRYSNGMAIGAEPTGIGDYVIYSVPVPEIGKYEIRIGSKTGPNRGHFQVASAPGNFDFTNIGEEIGFYSYRYRYAEEPVGTFEFTSTGTKHFRFMVTGKNALSSGYIMVLDYIKLVKL